MKPAEYERMRAAEERQWWYVGMRAISRALLDKALVGGSRRIFDAGCGTGFNVRMLRRYGTAVGLDLSAEALACGRELGVPLARGDLASLPFEGDTFDVVTSFDVLYHRWVPDDRSAVRELVRVLRPGGWLLVRVPALRCLWGAHDEEVLTRHRYTRRELVELLEVCGLTVSRATYCNTLLFPVIALHRLLDRWTRRAGSDVGFLPAPLEALFRGALGLEARWLGRRNLPLGSSVLALGRKSTSDVRPAGLESMHEEGSR